MREQRWIAVARFRRVGSDRGCENSLIGGQRRLLRTGFSLWLSHLGSGVAGYVQSEKTSHTCAAPQARFVVERVTEREKSALVVCSVARPVASTAGSGQPGNVCEMGERGNGDGVLTDRCLFVCRRVSNLTPTHLPAAAAPSWPLLAGFLDVHPCRELGVHGPPLPPRRCRSGRPVIGTVCCFLSFARATLCCPLSACAASPAFMPTVACYSQPA